ncbi:MAG: type II secretion system F family protein [Candidatus Pacearchaeota archaeon]|nr:type II secretion system F family protein [Candidatus Pacearchaeota archaeon]
MYPLLARLFPWYTKIIEKMAVYVDMKKDPREYTKVIILAGIIIGVIGFAAVLIFLNWMFAILALIVCFGLTLFVSYILLMLEADKRAKEAENALPDALQLMATNLRAGLTTDKAFLVSARDEFGVLNTEFKKVAKEIATGKDLVDALTEMAKRIKSDIVARTTDLITFGITSGGELAPLLEESAISLRQQLLTRKQIHASVMMYTIFIFIAVGFISPLLFGLSTVLSEIMSSTLGSIGTIPPEVAANVPLTVATVILNPTFIRFFAIALLIVSAILSSLVLGLINTGEEKDGLKFIPILLACGLATFFIVRVAIKMVLSYFIQS